MVEQKKRSKRLSQIMQSNKHFDLALESYIDQLNKRRDWQNLEKKLIECKKLGWPQEKLKKIFQWERKACELHSKALDRAMEIIRHMADAMTDEQFQDLKEWIKFNPHSKEVWGKNIVSIHDSLSHIKAKVMHLTLISRSPVPINIGKIIKNKE